jgi:hypothetical protein
MPGPPEPEHEQRQRALDLATLDAQIATQNRTAFLQSLPPSDTKPIDAKTTVDANVVFEAHVLAYRMLRRVAGRIADHVHGKLPEDRALLIHTDTDMTALTAFRTFVAQVSELGSAYDALAPKEQPPNAQFLFAAVGVVAATATIKTVVDLVALLRTERNISGVAVTIEDMALISEVGGALARNDRKVFVTQLYPLPVDGGAIERRLDGLRRQAVAAAERVDALESPTEKTTSRERLQQLDVIRKGYENLFTNLPSSAPAFPLAIGVPDPGGNAVTTLVRGAGVDALLSREPGSSVLYLKVLKAGGSNETKRNLVRSKLEHSGGVVVNYILFDEDGSILSSSTADVYSGEMEIVPETE